MGVFAEWQPAYAEAGIATFPVVIETETNRKKPTVGNYQRAGRRASAQWALKFPEVNALGFLCGERNGLTIADIDTPDERVLAEVEARLGRSSIIARTASGKFHVWYRHNGERRKIRAPGFSGPVDILGGGFAVAPPSQGSSGRYEFIQGSLADLDSLPVMRGTFANALPNHSAPASEVVGEGGRNQALYFACLREAPFCQSELELRAFALARNQSGSWVPLPDEEVGRTAASAWRCQVERRNGLAGDRYVQIPKPTHLVLQANPDASFIYGLLKFHHWGRDFAIANEWRLHLPCGEWSLPRFRAARKFLLDAGLIELVRPEGRSRPAIFRFSDEKSPLGGLEGRGV